LTAKEFKFQMKISPTKSLKQNSTKEIDTIDIVDI